MYFSVATYNHSENAEILPVEIENDAQYLGSNFVSWKNREKRFLQLSEVAKRRWQKSYDNHRSAKDAIIGMVYCT